MNLVVDQAKLVYTGVDYKVFQIDEELSDGRMLTSEIIQWRNSCKIIPIEGDQILLAHEQKAGKGGYDTLLWGRIGRHENLQDGAAREFLEESGMIMHDMKHLFTFTRLQPIRFEVNVFVTHEFSKVAEPVFHPGEKIKVKKVSFDEFIKIVQSEHFRWEEFKDKIREIAKDPSTLKDFKKQLWI